MVCRFSAALLAALIAPALTYAAADPKLIESCADCHGDKGASTAADVPTIAGISATVQSDWLKAYRGKTTPCPKVTPKRGDTKHQSDMCSVAKDLTDSQIADLADHFSKLPYVGQQQAADAAKAAAGKLVHDRDCKKCHSAGGKDPNDDAGILAAQPLGWLKATLVAFQAGDKEQPKKMKEVTSKLSGADVEALAHFYAGEH